MITDLFILSQIITDFFILSQIITDFFILRQIITDFSILSQITTDLFLVCQIITDFFILHQVIMNLPTPQSVGQIIPDLSISKLYPRSDHQWLVSPFRSALIFLSPVFILGRIINDLCLHSDQHWSLYLQS